MSDISVKLYKCGRSLKIGMCTKNRKKTFAVPPTLSRKGSAMDDEGRPSLIREICILQLFKDDMS